MMVTKKKTIKKTNLEKQYEELFIPITTQPELSNSYSLAQPSPLKTISSIVTYGAYEEPIIGE